MLGGVILNTLVTIFYERLAIRTHWLPRLLKGVRNRVVQKSRKQFKQLLEPSTTLDV